MGAWIETIVLGLSVGGVMPESHPIWVRGLKLMSYNMDNYAQAVAPYMGAWIETYNGWHETEVYCTSHPIWVRGLKQLIYLNQVLVVHVAPYMGAWIETHACTSLSPNQLSSHPIWVRGLKHCTPYLNHLELQPHPIWVRGLKQNSGRQPYKLHRRTLYGCVD